MKTTDTAREIATYLIASIARERGVVTVYFRTQPDAWQVIVIYSQFRAMLDLVLSQCLHYTTEILSWARANAPESECGPTRFDIEVWERDREGRASRHAPGTLLAESPFISSPELMDTLPEQLPGGWTRLGHRPDLRY